MNMSFPSRTLLISLKRPATASCLTLALILAGCSNDTEQSNTPAPDTSPPPVTSQTNTVPAPPSEPVDLSYLPTESAIGVIVRVRELLDLEMTKWLPVEVAEAVGKDRLGIDIHDITDVIITSLPPSEQSPVPEVGGILRFSKDYELSGLFGGLDDLFGPRLTIQKTPIAGLPALTFSDGDLTIEIAMADKRTLLAGTPGMVGRMILAKEPADSSSLVSQIKQLKGRYQIAYLGSMEALGPDLIAEAQNQLASAPLPPTLIKLANGMLRTRGASFQTDLSNGFKVRATIDARTPAAARELSEDIVVNLEFLRTLGLIQAQAIETGDDVLDQSFHQYLERVSQLLVETFQPSVEENQVVFVSENGLGLGAVPAFTPVLVALLLPAVSSARDAARRMSSSNNLKQIGLALRTYHNTYGRFPVGENPQIQFKDGKPLLSWRVYLLPFIEQDPLYSQFKLDEPWDSPHNIKLSRITIPSYTDPKMQLEPGMTTYLAPMGPNTVLGANRSMKYRDITDGESQVIAVLEAGAENAVPWSKPDDWTPDPEDIVGSLSLDREQAQVLMVDGSVHSISLREIMPETLLRLIQRNDGQPLPPGVFGPFGRPKRAIPLEEFQLEPDEPATEEGPVLSREDIRDLLDDSPR